MVSHGPGTSAPTTVGPGPSVVTLQPTDRGHIPGDVSDSSDFYGLGAAILSIALVIVLAKLAFRNRRPPEVRERGD